MSSKRAREDTSAAGGDGDDRKKKARHGGFRVGPDNLPDGTWRRKVTKIKKDLIVKAKIKKQYAKIKADYKQHNPQPAAIPVPADELEPPIITTAAAATKPDGDIPDKQQQQQQEPASGGTPPPQIHPERQAMLDEPPTNTQPRQPRPLRPPRQQQQQQAQNPDPDPTRPEPNRDNDGDGDGDGDHGDGDRQRQRAATKRRHGNPNKPDYFAKELEAAKRTREAAEKRAAEAARRTEERNRRIADRERYRRAMDKAKAPGRDGKLKLGRESALLLDRVKRMVGES